MIIDIHNHTQNHSPCSIISAFDLIEIYIQKGIDGICITDHNYIWEEEEQTRIQQKYSDKIKIFFGCEVDTDVGHVLVFSKKYHKFTKIPVNLNKLVEIFPDNESAFIWAHPFRWEDYKTSHMDLLSKFNAVELFNGNLTDTRIQYTYEKLSSAKLRFTGGSDTHSKEIASKYATEFSGDISDLDDLIESLKKGCFNPVKI